MPFQAGYRSPAGGLNAETLVPALDVPDNSNYALCMRAIPVKPETCDGTAQGVGIFPDHVHRIDAELLVNPRTFRRRDPVGFQLYHDLSHGKLVIELIGNGNGFLF